MANYSYDYKNQLKTLDYGNGDKVQYTYDEDGNVTRATYSNDTSSASSYIGYAYDASGALVEVTDSATGRTASFTYDIKKRLAKQLEQGTGFSHSVRYSYNDYDQIVSIIESVGSSNLTTNYTYDDEHRVSSVTAENASQTYTYDGFSRLRQQTTKHNSATIKTDEYIFDVNSRVAQHTVKQNGVNTLWFYRYTYDGNGNIESIVTSDNEITYTYDAAGQLIREDNPLINRTYVWTYDASGNIRSRKEYTYTDPDESSLTGGVTVSYNYDNSNWGDLLTSYNGQSISYDAIGNMTSDGTRSYTWEHGRQLKTLSTGGKTWTYTYDTNGMRAGRSTSGTSYSYVYNGSQLSYMTVDGNTLQFIYSATGTPMAVICNDTYYYYVTNVQGDVVAILNTQGNVVITYTYDTWGKLYTEIDEYDPIVAQLNPLLYRGYVYDPETQLYYLQSRYYNPEIGRFINADSISYLGADSTPASFNLYVYCSNNPVIYKDTSGNAIETVFDIISLGSSIVGVAINPADPWAWLELIGDLADVAIPGVGGLGEAVKALKALGYIDDTIDMVKITENTLQVISTAAHALSAGGDFVYKAYIPGQQGFLEYVGITNDFDRRRTEWNGIRDIKKWITGVDRDTARYAEQTVITLFGRKGNTLSNIRNSIGKNGALFGDYLKFFKSLF